MADSVSPWLLAHFLTTAETYGAQIYSIPLYDKKKKVQITEFLTFGLEDQDTYIWARVSDKQYVVPIKFSKEAVAEFRKLTGRRLTQHKGAIIAIKQFKCILSRIPMENPTKQAYLALECEAVSLLGSSGESTFGNPVSLTNHPDMHLWSKALNKAGGAGNVLKERKEQRDREAEHANAAFLQMQISMPPPPTISPRPRTDDRLKEKVLPLRKTRVTDMASYYARWQIVEKNNHLRYPPAVAHMDNTPPKPESVEKSSSPARQIAPADVPPQDDKVNTPRSRSGTPITSWEQSPSNSAPSPTHESKPLSIDTGNTTTSSLVPPTPAQRTKWPTFTPSDLPTSSLPAAANESILDDASGHESGTEVRPPVSRKVPRPTSPQPRRHTGPALVLVPNSDTSGTQSQSLSLTQSQSQSQSQPQPLIQESDAQVESSAPNNAARPTKEEIREESDDDMAMEVDHEREQRHRRSNVLGSEAASSGGESSSSEKSSREDDGRRYADGSETESDEDDDSNDGVVDRGDEEDNRVETEMEADWSDDGYPWMTLWSVRGIIVKADALRERLHNNVLR